MSANPLETQWGALVGALTTHYQAGDQEHFFAALDQIFDARERSLSREQQQLAESLRHALEQFCKDSRLADLAGREMPDARASLDHALKLTEQAAHRTMDLVEKSGPLADRTGKEAAALAASWRDIGRGQVVGAELQDLFAKVQAFLAAAQLDSEVVRSNLAEVLMTQSFQDLSGQIIRNVIKLVAELERALTQFAALAGGSAAAPSATAAAAPLDSQGYGPAIPGVSKGTVGEQTDVDALLADLGM